MTSFPVWQHCRKEVQSAVKSIWSSKIHLKTWLKSKDDKFGNPVGTQAAFLKYRHTVSVQQTGLKQQHCLERSDYTQHRTERNKRSIADVFAVLSQCVCVSVWFFCALLSFLHSFAKYMWGHFYISKIVCSDIHKCIAIHVYFYNDVQYNYDTFT